MWKLSRPHVLKGPRPLPWMGLRAQTGAARGVLLPATSYSRGPGVWPFWLGVPSVSPLQAEVQSKTVSIIKNHWHWKAIGVRDKAGGLHTCLPVVVSYDHIISIIYVPDVYECKTLYFPDMATCCSIPRLRTFGCAWRQLLRRKNSRRPPRRD